MVCILSVILCPEIMAPVNGTLVISTPSPTQPLIVGTTATYSCDPGLVLVGDLTRTCEDSGTGTVGNWSGSEVDPICESTADMHQSIVFSDPWSLNTIIAVE